MRLSLPTLLVAAAGMSLVAVPGQAADPSGEQQLAKLIEGRTAGTARSCINTSGSQGLTIIDKTAIVYRQGGRVWVNRTTNPESLDDDDILVIRKFGTSNLCRSDNITTLDRSSRMFNGVIFLEDFVPYEKAG